jgi:hypothetical protein
MAAKKTTTKKTARKTARTAAKKTAKRVARRSWWDQTIFDLRAVVANAPTPPMKDQAATGVVVRTAAARRAVAQAAAQTQAAQLERDRLNDLMEVAARFGANKHNRRAAIRLFELALTGLYSLSDCQYAIRP